MLRVGAFGRNVVFQSGNAFNARPIATFNSKPTINTAWRLAQSLQPSPDGSKPLPNMPSVAGSSAMVSGLGMMLIRRGFSSSTGPAAKPPGLDNQNIKHNQKQQLSLFQQLHKWLQPFMTGSKSLFLENKEAWAIRQRLIKKAKEESATHATANHELLTRREMMILRQAHRDLLKSIPLLLFFWVPLIGYLAPLIGYKYPKQLLPWQFWRPEQKTRFFQEDAQAKAVFHAEIRDILLKLDRKDHAIEVMLAVREDEPVLLPTELAEVASFFDDNAPADLKNLTRHHLQLLAYSSAVVPVFAQVTVPLLPKSMLLQLLQKRMEALGVDDLMLVKENAVDELSLCELEFACEERGIVDGYGKIEELRVALKDWLSMYEPKQTKIFPPSMLLHAPALTDINVKPTAKTTRNTTKQQHV